MMALATASCAPAKLLMQKSQTRRRGLKLGRVGRVCSANSVEDSVASSEACLIMGLGRGPQVLDSKKSPKFLLTFSSLLGFFGVEYLRSTTQAHDQTGFTRRYAVLYTICRANSSNAPKLQSAPSCLALLHQELRRSA